MMFHTFIFQEKSTLDADLEQKRIIFYLTYYFSFQLCFYAK